MAALATSAPRPRWLPADVRRQGPPQRGSFPVWRWVILLVAGVYFLLPLYAALRFAGIKAFGVVFTQPGFGAALWLSVRLAVVTWLITMALMVPTTIYVHLRLPRLRAAAREHHDPADRHPAGRADHRRAPGAADARCKATLWLLALEYVILAMPFAYRAIDAGLRAIDLKTLTEASSNARRRAGSPRCGGCSCRTCAPRCSRRPC